MNVHSRDLICSFCNQVFTRPFCLKRHLKNIHDHQQCDVNEEILKEFKTFSDGDSTALQKFIWVQSAVLIHSFYAELYSNFHKGFDLNALVTTLNESRTSDECALILGQLEESNAKLREYPHQNEDEQRSMINHLSDLIDEARYKFTQKRKSEIAEQTSILDQQIAAWGLPSKPIENPFQVVLNKNPGKTRK
ncbi:c2H2-type domain-containing protein [Trichonephila clavipes]|nr:c2H2-type domain-containing protein [Trichonephila clavipes]